MWTATDVVAGVLRRSYENGGIVTKLASGMVEGQEVALCVTEQGLVRVDQLAARYGRANGEAWTVGRILAQGQLERVQEWQDRAQSEGMEVVEPAEMLAPVTYPGKIICVGLNYRPHVTESAFDMPTHPVLFNKYVNAVVGPDAVVRAPLDSTEFDYEAELVLVMGRVCHQVSESQALDYVAGYCNGNDLSARDLQFRTSQWLLGKAGDGMGPMGPYLVTRDDVPDPDQLEIIGKRNGEVVQHSNTREMIFSCRYLISYISRYITLEPGDVIFTGTPEGVILGQPTETRRWLQPGEVVSVQITGLGELETRIG
ncbi:MAG: FAA hydrolase family protein [Sulfobacillus acidophilus]|uniref:FAA hydrolase family protein n=1 Tax=Sulfobacillus acidophilus TaxID=53633 RepID=A0A2T2WJH6_9FIRM|nr:MAG: FAA hydrolase family protein [Sulfobacillus acidophilus]